MLNAFRHHRLFHISGFSTQCKLLICAQRLSASQTIPQKHLVLQAAFVVVLNAFRHHRLFHPVMPGRLVVVEDVLNAFRHHRLFHVPIGVASWQCSRCSTPFGITDYSTQWWSCEYRTPLVLNAFRHHRLFHSAERGGCMVLFVCSTPFGITDYSTRSQATHPPHS